LSISLSVLSPLEKITNESYITRGVKDNHLMSAIIFNTHNHETYVGLKSNVDPIQLNEALLAVSQNYPNGLTPGLTDTTTLATPGDLDEGQMANSQGNDTEANPLDKGQKANLQGIDTEANSLDEGQKANSQEEDQELSDQLSDQQEEGQTLQNYPNGLTPGLTDTTTSS